MVDCRNRPDEGTEATTQAAPLWAEHGWALSGRAALAIVGLVLAASLLVNSMGDHVARLAGLN